MSVNIALACYFISCKQKYWIWANASRKEKKKSSKETQWGIWFTEPHSTIWRRASFPQYGVVTLPHPLTNMHMQFTMAGLDSITCNNVAWYTACITLYRHTLQSNRISHKIKKGKLRAREKFLSPVAIAAWQTILQNIKNKADFNNTKSKALIKHNVN